MGKQIFSLEEMRDKFKGEWVFLQNCKFDKRGNLEFAKVTFHSSNRDDVYRKLRDYRDYKGKCAIRYLGEIPRDLTVVL